MCVYVYVYILFTNGKLSPCGQLCQRQAFFLVIEVVWCGILTEKYRQTPSLERVRTTKTARQQNLGALLYWGILEMDGIESPCRKKCLD